MEKKHAVAWFEIFISDSDRMRHFYETVFGVELTPEADEEARMLIFPFDQKHGIGGCLSQMEGGKPGTGGTMVYLNADGDLDGTLERVWQQGGKVTRPRTPIPPHGFFAHFEDPEGNPVGIWSLS